MSYDPRVGYARQSARNDYDRTGVIDTSIGKPTKTEKVEAKQNDK